MRAAHIVNTLTYCFSVILLAFSAIAVIVMAVHVTADVLGRTVFSQPILGTTEIVSFYYMVAVVCLPLAYVELRDEHITVDLLYLTLPLWMKKTVFVFSCLATAGFFGLFGYESWLVALSSMASREMVMGSAFIEIWPSRFLLPIGFGLLIVATLLRAVKAIITSGNPEDQAK